MGTAAALRLGAATCVLLAAALAGATPARAQAGDIEVSPRLEMLSDAEIAERLSFIENRLEAGKTYAQVWQYGWTGIYTVTAVAGAYGAITADDGDARALSIVSGVKSALAAADLIGNPLPARLGAAPLTAVPGTGRDAQLQRLALGERALLDNAELADRRYNLRPHVQNVTVNAIGGLLVWYFGNSTDALVSLVGGIAVGEAQIWSQPWRASADLREYRGEFPGAIAEGWELRPRLNGAELAYRF